MATITTLAIKDGANSNRTLRALDFSGSGAGPFIPLHALTDEDGALITAANPLEIADSVSAPASSIDTLTYAMTSDTTDLSVTARSLRVYNGSANPVTLMVLAEDDTNQKAITIPAGSLSYEPIKVKRILRTGSTNLITAGAITTGVEITLLL